MKWFGFILLEPQQTTHAIFSKHIHHALSITAIAAHLLLAIITLMTEPVLDAQAQDTTRQAGYDRPVSPSNQSRSVVIAKNGMVATSHPFGRSGRIGRF